jgi:hypothetical protein
MGCTWLSNFFKYSLAVILPWRLIIGLREYCTMILLPKPSQSLPHISLLKPGVPNYRLPWVFSTCKLFLMQGNSMKKTHLIISSMLFQLSDVQVLWSWHHHLCIWELLTVVRGLAVAALLWMLDLWSSYQTVFVEWIWDEYSVLLSPVLQ